MANQLRFSKVVSLPSTLAPSTVYLLPSATGGYMEMRVSTLDGSGTYRIVTIDDVNTLIGTAASSATVSQYPNYSALTSSTVKQGIAFVEDMSDFKTPDSLSSNVRGLFIWDTVLTTPAWTLITVFESGSNSAVGRISEDSSKNITYRGLPIPVTLSAEAW